MPRFRLNKSQPWMVQDEAIQYKRLIRDLDRIARKRAIPTSPLLELRIDDLAVTFILVRRTEARLDAVYGDTTTTAVEAVGKVRERLRKTVKEFEEFVQKTGRPEATNIAEAAAPLMLRIGDTLDQFWIDDEHDTASPPASTTGNTDEPG